MTFGPPPKFSLIRPHLTAIRNEDKNVAWLRREGGLHRSESKSDELETMRCEWL